MSESNTLRLFFPYYVNQGRLLDIFAILNNGYSEYAEVYVNNLEEQKKETKGTLNGGSGFKILNIGGDVSFSKKKATGNESGAKEKKVQTISSMLSSVIAGLEEKGYIVDISSVKPGQFVLIPVWLKINSIKALVKEALDLTKLAESMGDLGAAGSNKSKASKEFEKVSKSIQMLFDGEEIIYENDDYAVFANIQNQHMYQSNREDIIEANLICFGQVKRVFPQGTDLMRNTIFSRIKDKKSKEELIKSVKSLSEGETFEFEATAVASICGKPVYQLEIVALYQ